MGKGQGDQKWPLYFVHWHFSSIPSGQPEMVGDKNTSPQSPFYAKETHVAGISLQFALNYLTGATMITFNAITSVVVRTFSHRVDPLCSTRLLIRSIFSGPVNCHRLYYY